MVEQDTDRYGRGASIWLEQYRKDVLKYFTDCKVTVPCADIVDMTLFQSENYRDFLSDYVARLPKKGRGELSRIAKSVLG